MIRHFATADDVSSFLAGRGLSRQRIDLLKAWRRWEKGSAPHLLAAACDHEGSLHEWGCECTFGCDCCRIHVKCSACGAGFRDLAEATRVAGVWLVLKPEENAA